jgi:hypothetical protein
MKRERGVYRGGNEPTKYVTNDIHSRRFAQLPGQATDGRRVQSLTLSLSS